LRKQTSNMATFDTEATAFVEAWTSIRGYINKKDRVDAATAFLKSINETYDLYDLVDDLYGHDASLDKALAELEVLESDELEHDEQEWDE